MPQNPEFRISRCNLLLTHQIRVCTVFTHFTLTYAWVKVQNFQDPELKKFKSKTCFMPTK